MASRRIRVLGRIIHLDQRPCAILTSQKPTDATIPHGQCPIPGKLESRNERSTIKRIAAQNDTGTVFHAGYKKRTVHIRII